MKIYKPSFFLSVIAILIISITTPVFFFIFHFKNSGISNSISNWGAFGDYFGGVLNTIISFLSLLILGYLTLLVSRQSNEENKKNNILLRRLDAYENLISYLPSINQSLRKINKKSSLISHIYNNPSAEFNIEVQEHKKELFHSISSFANFYYFLHSFSTRYGHIFNYDFKSENYNLLLDKGNKLNNLFLMIQDSFEFDGTINTIKDPKIAEDFFDLFVDFIYDLKSELKFNLT